MTKLEKLQHFKAMGLSDKLANEVLEAAEGAPAPEAAAQAAPGGHEGLDPAQIDEMLASLSPEELQALMAHIEELTAGQGVEGGAPGPQDAPQPGGLPPQAAPGGQPAGPENLGKLAAQISEYVHPVTNEKTASEIPHFKTAAYIEGFLEAALERGLTVKEAADGYIESLINTEHAIEKAAFAPGSHNFYEQHRGDLNEAMPGIDPDTATRLHASKLLQARNQAVGSETSNLLTQGGIGALLGGLAGRVGARGFGASQGAQRMATRLGALTGSGFGVARAAGQNSDARALNDPAELEALQDRFAREQGLASRGISR